MSTSELVAEVANLNAAAVHELARRLEEAEQALASRFEAFTT